MKITVCSYGAADMGMLGQATAIKETFDIPETDHPWIEITLAGGRSIRLDFGNNTLEVHPIVGSAIVLPGNALRIMIADIGVVDGSIVIGERQRQST